MPNKKNDESIKDILITAAKEDLDAATFMKEVVEDIEEQREEHKKEVVETHEESSEIRDELLGMDIENEDGTKTKRAKKSQIFNGILFLGRSFATQWRTLITITVIFLLVVIGIAGLTYGVQYIGNGSNGFHTPDSDHTNLTFFECVWWVFITISTVGFGDIYPLTVAMRAWAMFIGIIGIIFVSLFTAVVVNGFAIELQKNIEKRKERIEKNKTRKDNDLLLQRMQIDLAERDLEIDELKWALSKVSGESVETIESAIDKAREHAMKNALNNKKTVKKVKAANKEVVKSNKKPVAKKPAVTKTNKKIK